MKDKQKEAATKLTAKAIICDCLTGLMLEFLFLVNKNLLNILRFYYCRHMSDKDQ